MIAYQFQPGPLYQRSKPVRDARYLAYLRTFPCVACKTSRRIESAHFGLHSADEKASDLNAVPLCEKCHRTGKQAAHSMSREAFEQAHSIDLAALQRMFQRFYVLKHGNPAHWPHHPNVTLLQCSKCQHEDFQEEFEVRGECPGCGRKVEVREAA